MSLMSLSNIYELVKAEYDKQRRENTSLESKGICAAVDEVFKGGFGLGPWDELAFEKHFSSQKPRINTNKEFFNEHHYTGKTYWWDNSKKELSDKSRMLFLEKMIEITKEESDEKTS